MTEYEMQMAKLAENQKLAPALNPQKLSATAATMATPQGLDQRTALQAALQSLLRQRGLQEDDLNMGLSAALNQQGMESNKLRQTLGAQLAGRGMDNTKGAAMREMIYNLARAKKLSAAQLKRLEEEMAYQQNNMLSGAMSAVGGNAIGKILLKILGL